LYLEGARKRPFLPPKAANPPPIAGAPQGGLSCPCGAIHLLAPYEKFFTACICDNVPAEMAGKRNFCLAHQPSRRERSEAFGDQSSQAPKSK
ncbi:MAG: hypothetical protein IJZ66_08930, partial [Oscillibacter sp.]|nr:hypothetical protein [Oscillibacter sp.]